MDAPDTMPVPPDPDAVAARIASALRLAYFWARRYRRQFANTRLEQDDLDQEALLALCRAAKQFDPGREVKFSTYASTAITRQLRESCCREAQRLARQAALRREGERLLRRMPLRIWRGNSEAGGSPGSGGRPACLSQRKVAALLGLSVAAVHSLINAGDLPCIRTRNGRCAGIPVAAVARYVRSLDGLLTVPEAAQRLQVTVGIIARMLKRGELPGARGAGRGARIPVAAVTAAAEQRAARPMRRRCALDGVGCAPQRAGRADAPAATTPREVTDAPAR